MFYVSIIQGRMTTKDETLMATLKITFTDVLPLIWPKRN